MKNSFLSILLLVICFNLSAYQYSQEKAGFSVEVNGEINPYKIFSTFIMPGKVVMVKSQVTLSLKSNDLQVSNNENWQITAPEKPGIYSVAIEGPGSKKMTLNILVLTPLPSQISNLNGYKIGNYPARPLKGNPIYNKPAGLFEVTTANENTQLTPHFTLKQFLCKQEGGYPKYLIVRERLLLKLEYILEKVNNSGFETETFGFISGYRTPFYNASIKNVQYSRHVYGGAADIIIDQDNDGSLDDLNKDGKIDENDVRVFYNIVADEFEKPTYDKFKGGLGFYKKNARHNGFIHVDVRGWKARW